LIQVAAAARSCRDRQCQVAVAWGLRQGPGHGRAKPPAQVGKCREPACVSASPTGGTMKEPALRQSFSNMATYGSLEPTPSTSF
jgi:hypothetical protein